MQEVAYENLDFPILAHGTHETPHELHTLLYVNAENHPVNHLAAAIASGSLGELDADRKPLIKKFHTVIYNDLARGLSPITIKNRIRALRRFYNWCDLSHIPITLSTVESSFVQWTNYLIHRSQVVRDIDPMTAYREGRAIDVMLSKILGLKVGLLSKTRLKPPNQNKRALGTQADKQKLDETFRFGSFLLHICKTLTISVIEGPLPVRINFGEASPLIEWSGFKRRDSALKNLKRSKRDLAQVEATKKLMEGDPTLISRRVLVNLRIEAELLIFIAQTGMNLSQAYKLKKEPFRFKTHGDGFEAFRVYKKRRHGEALFHIFKEYRSHFEVYFDWIEEVKEEEDDRLFPFVRYNIIPAAHVPPTFQAVRARCVQTKVRFVPPGELRKTRINWLLRKSEDPKITAEMAQHSQATLIRIYEQPHHQTAANQISRFHRATDPAMAAPGQGLCVTSVGMPKLVPGEDAASPPPNCANAAGCFFCEYHRDIDTEDYVWSITTYRYLKILELERFSSPKKEDTPHPAKLVIDKISDKLEFLSSTSDLRSKWVMEAKNRIREGRFHPMHQGYIKLLEIM